MQAQTHYALIYRWTESVKNDGKSIIVFKMNHFGGRYESSCVDVISFLDFSYTFRCANILTRNYSNAPIAEDACQYEH